MPTARCVHSNAQKATKLPMSTSRAAASSVSGRSDLCSTRRAVHASFYRIPLLSWMHWFCTCHRSRPTRQGSDRARPADCRRGYRRVHSVSAMLTRHLSGCDARQVSRNAKVERCSPWLRWEHRVCWERLARTAETDAAGPQETDRGSEAHRFRRPHNRFVLVARQPSAPSPGLFASWETRCWTSLHAPRASL